jgi:fucose 4-O-acetylase-like acetyltransferase
VIFYSTGLDWWRSNPFTIPSCLYIVAFILCFLAFDEVSIPFARHFQQIGSASLGIYLLHYKVLEFTARAIQKFMPWLLAYQLLFLPILVILAVWGVWLFMAAIAKLPTRRFYRYLFG